MKTNYTETSKISFKGTTYAGYKSESDRKSLILSKTIGKVITVIITVSTFVTGCSTNPGPGSTSNSVAETYQEKVMTVAEIEQSQPTNFLSADGTYEENFWGDKLKVSCSITNKATVATYKDAVVRITYYSKTKSELGSKDYTVYEIFPPHSKKTIELKIENYKDVNSIGWDVVQASVN